MEFDSAAWLSIRPGSVWNYLWGHALKRSPGINRKSRVLYPGHGFLSSATWPSLPKKHYNGLNNQCYLWNPKLKLWSNYVFKCLWFDPNKKSLHWPSVDEVNASIVRFKPTREMTLLLKKKTRLSGVQIQMKSDNPFNQGCVPNSRWIIDK